MVVRLAIVDEFIEHTEALVLERACARQSDPRARVGERRAARMLGLARAAEPLLEKGEVPQSDAVHAVLARVTSEPLANTTLGGR